MKTAILFNVYRYDNSPGNNLIKTSHQFQIKLMKLQNFNAFYSKSTKSKFYSPQNLLLVNPNSKSIWFLLPNSAHENLPPGYFPVWGVLVEVGECIINLEKHILFKNITDS